jgi:prepilin-type N-terminal cleavage/methylation domain-containing protein
VKKVNQVLRHEKPALRNRRSASGFTLIELMISATVFLIVTSMAFSLFNQHLQLASRQVNLSGVNIGMRNAMAQMELDMSAGGQNVLGTVLTGAPVFGLGVNIQNNVPGVAALCKLNADWSYPIPSACYDGITIYTVKPCTLAGGTTAPVLVISDPLNGSEFLNSTSTLWGTDNNPGANLANDASCFAAGDEIMIVQFPTGGQLTTKCDNPNPFNFCVGVVTLTQPAVVSGGLVKLPHNAAGAGNDPLGVIFNGGATNNFSLANGLGIGYASGAYIVDLGTAANTITYAVQANPLNAADPQLVRCTGGVCNSVVDQVIGFKVGASLWDNKQAAGTDIANYFYSAAKYCNGANTDCSVSPPPANDPYDFSLVRSVRISLIGRTPPASDLAASKLKNGFDQGPYMIQQAAVVVDLRNMSDNDSDN